VRGGPFRLQIWRRTDDAFSRVYAGEGPARSPAVDAWLFAVDEGQLLRIAADEGGTDWWMTGEEAQRATAEAERRAKEDERRAKEDERRAKEDERRAKEDALRRVAELEARLAERR
jgi:hypothetical protein